MIRKIDHVGIAVRRLDDGLGFWSEALHLPVAGREEVDTEGVRVAFVPVGDSRLELLEPSRPDSPIARFLEKRGEGLHQIAFTVDDAQAVLERVRARGLPMLDASPRPGAEGTRVAFLHPRATGGVLVELVERPRAAAEDGGLRPGSPVLVYLKEPGEKLWGVMRQRDAAGITIEGLDLSSFDDWTAQVERGDPHPVGPSLLFFPMARVERILADRRSGALPSLAEQFERRTGRNVTSVLGSEG